EAEAPDGSPINGFVRGMLESLGRPRPGAAEDLPEPLAGHGDLSAALSRWAGSLRPPTAGQARLVLIFDQFEEILTINPTDIAAREDFFDQLGLALKAPGLWALFAMREEYVGALEPYLNRTPRRLASRFRLDLFTAESAREAFERTFALGGVSVDPGA